MAIFRCPMRRSSASTLCPKRSPNILTTAPPSSAEEGGAVVRMFGDLFGHNVDAEDRRIGQRKMAIRVHCRRPGDEVLRPGRVEGVEVLLDHEVGNGGRELEADCRSDRP